jgi:hypothetical protein
MAPLPVMRITQTKRSRAALHAQGRLLSALLRDLV